MRDDAKELLRSFLKSPEDPRWSSFALDRLFAALDGETKEKLQQLLPVIDDRLSVAEHTLSEPQANFIRDVTIKNYTDPESAPFTAKELSWLIDRLHKRLTPQRALMVALLVPFDELQSETSQAIVDLLSGTAGEKWIAVE